MRIYAEEKNLDFFDALASKTRLQIIRLLSIRPLNIKEIASKVDVSPAIVTRHIAMLENCGIVKSESRPSNRGRQKICCLAEDIITVLLSSSNQLKTQEKILTIGGYSKAIDLQAPCGLKSEKMVKGIIDDPRYFLIPDRETIKHLWFSHGMLKYRINEPINGTIFKSITVRMLLCVESHQDKSQYGAVVFGFCNEVICERTIKTSNLPKMYTIKLDERGVSFNGEIISNKGIGDFTFNVDDFSFEIVSGYYEFNKSIVNLFSTPEQLGITINFEMI